LGDNAGVLGTHSIQGDKELAPEAKMPDIGQQILR
jgi:hypothetical protein